MNKSSNYFRPKARHIFAIWRDLIKDDFSALIELVKNSYDADATKVDIIFEELDNKQLKLVVSDDWHWMSEETIKKDWLVPSTNIKKKEKVSQGWRILQGQKWIWRYAASILGDLLTLTTVRDKIQTSIQINWKDFEQDRYLDEIILNIETKIVNQKNGTTIEIIWDEKKLNFWKEDVEWKNDRLINYSESSINFRKFKRELEKLIPPFKNKSSFCMLINYLWERSVIENKDILEYFDYRITWQVDFDGNLTCEYENADTKEKKKISKIINLNSKDNEYKNQSQYPWNIKFNFLVLDRDPIKERSEISRNEWRITNNRNEILDYYKNFSWVSIYRWWFRIRPYGEVWEDWLNLNARRVNNPSLRLSANQIIWYISIEWEEDSKLIEASSREKLKENDQYFGLIYEIRKVLSILEEKRKKYRESRYKTKKQQYVDFEKEISIITDEIKTISTDSEKEWVVKKVEELWKKFVSEKERLEKIVYQYEWQVTLWKLMTITFHELSKPVKYIKENIKNIQRHIDKITNNQIQESKEKLIELLEWYNRNGKIISDFFAKNLKPLVNRSSKKSYFNIKKIINQVFDTYHIELSDTSVLINDEIKEDIMVFGHDTDYLVAMINFIDNSIYRLSDKKPDKKIIQVDLKKEDDKLSIYFKDNWSWTDYIEDKEDILEPWFTKKEWWTWLWLSIAWEVLERNNTKLEILDSNWEFNFILKIIISEWQK